MSEPSSYLNQMKCYLRDTDTIPIFDYYDNPNAFMGQLLIVCDGRHVLSYLKNPGKADLHPSSLMQYYSTLKTNYPLFFKNVPDNIFEKFIDVMNLLHLEYLGGASFGIRLLLETFVYSNYGVYAWYGDVTLRNKSNKDQIKEAYDNIIILGFDRFMEILISSNDKKELLSMDDEWLEKHQKLERKRLEIAKHVAKNLKPIENSDFLIGEDLLKELRSSFNELSPLVHSSEIEKPKTMSRSQEILESVIKAYEEFYRKNNKWRIEYE
ncbi:MAG: hypothetical protein QXU18_10390 [Thermoplasmatales archaeon]